MSAFGPKRVRFIPVEDGDIVDLGHTGPVQTSYYATKTPHLLVGFKPGPGPRPSGWLVVLVDDQVKGRHARQPSKRRSLKAVS
jgi:hypothetical protein